MSLSASAINRAFDSAWVSLSADVASGTLPSAVFAVATADETIRVEAVSSPHADWRAGTDSIYLLASITKPIVATAMLQLVEQGKILLNEPIAHHWPDFAVNHKESVTLWNLLTHTSGLDESYAARRMAVEASEVRRAEVAAVRDTFLSFPVGSRYRYCNAGFRVMVTLLEQLVGADYDAVIRARVLEPIGMKDTTFVPNLASDRVAPVLDFPYPMDAWLALASPSGGYWSTAADLIRFGQAWLNAGLAGGNRILGPATVAAAIRAQYEGEDDSQITKPAPLARGLGWALSVSSRSELVPPGCFGHGGATGTRLLVDPHHGLVIVFLTNRWGQPGFARERAINAFYGAL